MIIGTIVSRWEYSNRNKRGKKGRKSNSRSASDKYRVKMKELNAERERKNLEEKEKKMINNTEPLLSCLRSINLSKNLITGAGFSSIIAACSGVNWHPQLHGVQAMENKFNGRAMKTKLGHMISSSVLNRKCPLEILNMSELSFFCSLVYDPSGLRRKGSRISFPRSKSPIANIVSIVPPEASPFQE